MSEFDELIGRLAAATEGSAELDAAVISHLVGAKMEYVERAGRWCLYRDGTDPKGNARLWAPRGDDEYRLYRFLVDGRGPTRSLDAALPGERIIKTEIDADGWHATALTVDGRSVYGFGKTEALARRIAALRAGAAE